METKNKPVKVWMDGCFDMVHFGHANAIRQAKKLGDQLIVGVHSDAAITANKGPPVFNEQERYKMVRALKWIDEVVEDAPYVTQLAYLDQYDCDFCAHGNDMIMTADQQDTYHYVKKAGRYREFQRTEGISTTDLVERMLSVIKNDVEDSVDNSKQKITSKWTKGREYIPNTVRISQFQCELRDFLPNEKVVYVPGTFDLFHIGHISLIEKCLEWGTYIIIGLYTDQVANQLQNSNYPIMNLNERLLSVLSCKYVSNVLIGVEPVITEALIKSFRIDYVIQGFIKDHLNDDQYEKYFKVPKEMGIFNQIQSGSSITNIQILERISKNRIEYRKRNEEKTAKELTIQNS